MRRIDLQESFIRAMSDKISSKAELTDRIADILRIERESAYRRLAGKVNFSINEMGLLASQFGISVDRLLRKDDPDLLWIPFMLENPMQARSFDNLCDMMDLSLNVLEQMASHPCDSGHVYTSVPMEFFVFFPTLARFMFFKWGHHFVGTEEFNDFSNWKIPPRLTNIQERIVRCSNIKSTYYIWDMGLIMNMAWEIDYFSRMHIITPEEKNIIRLELKELLKNLERFLDGMFIPDIPLCPEMDFYVSLISLGFTVSSHASPNSHLVYFATPFSFSVIDDSRESYLKIRGWIDSLKNISTMLSRSGRVERKIFFDTQYKIIDQVLT